MLTILATLLIALALAFATPATAQPSITLNSPVPYQVFQRHSSTADIAISGTTGASGTIEARFNGGEWQPVAPIRNGAFSGVLVGQPQGQGGLEVRVTETPEITAGVPYVGIGDVFVVAGQSNAAGYGYTLNTAAHQWLKGSLFGNDYLWHELIDPTDSDTNQVDRISLDWGTSGSVWALVGTHLMNARSIPVAFVPAAKSGSSITEWQPPRNRFNRNTLYGSMAHRARLTGARAVLWWQGESDALGGMSGADYQARFSQIAGAIQSDLGIPIIPAILHNSVAIPDEQEVAIRQAVTDATAASANIIPGPDLSDLASDDQYHLLSDSNLQAAAERWWNALAAIVE